MTATCVGAHGTKRNPDRLFDRYIRQRRKVPQELTPPDLHVFFRKPLTGLDGNFITFIAHKGLKPSRRYSTARPSRGPDAAATLASVARSFRPWRHSNEQIYSAIGTLDLKPPRRRGVNLLLLSWAPDNHALAARLARKTNGRAGKASQTSAGSRVDHVGW